MLPDLSLALIATLIIEMLVSIFWGVRNKNDIIVIMLANICTNPLVVYVTICISMLNNPFIYVIAVIIMEISACIAEFIIYKKCLTFRRISPFALSLINNVVSFGLGLILYFIK